VRPEETEKEYKCTSLKIRREGNSRGLKEPGIDDNVIMEPKKQDKTVWIGFIWLWIIHFSRWTLLYGGYQLRFRRYRL
jgi:hypothetical protein